MTGLETSERFFQEAVRPVLSGFPDCLEFCSAAMLGDGSEVLGYDDALSRDHNFSPRVDLFLPDDTFDRVGQALNAHLRRSLPERFDGLELLWTEFRSAVRVLPLRRHFCQYLGLPALPERATDWLKCDEQQLLELTAGRIFHDPTGMLAGLRAQLRYYPSEVRFYLLRTCFVRMSECAGLERAIRRGDWIAVHHHTAFFVYFAIKAAHLLEQRYCPYHKWMARSLGELGEFGLELRDLILRLVSQRSLDAVREESLAILVRLADRLAGELGVASLRRTKRDELFLLDFDWSVVSELLNQHISEELRDLPFHVSPTGYLGMMFQYNGFGATYQDFLSANLDFLQQTGSGHGT